MAHYLDPKNDLTFKRVFGEHKHLCMSLINSMLPLEKPIVSIEYIIYTQHFVFQLLIQWSKQFAGRFEPAVESIFRYAQP